MNGQKLTCKQLQSQLDKVNEKISNAIEEIEKTPTHNGTVLHWADLYKRLMKALKNEAK